MRILDIDLDFFLDSVAYHRSPGGERLGDDYRPWDEEAVRTFLELRCGLRRSQPVPGRLVTHHHEAFLFWREFVEEARLVVPFEVVHVDAHADLGTGDAGYVYLMTDVLRRPVSERSRLEIGPWHLNDGNYLAFAAACRWIARVVYVAHPASHDDLLYLHFKNFDQRSGVLQLKGCDKPGLDAIFREEFTYPFALEPEIPFIRSLPEDFRETEGFDVAVLCQSPGFTPPRSDVLIPVIMEYIRSV
jgi:hypothetical protein